MRKINTVKEALLKDLCAVSKAVTMGNTKVANEDESIKDEKFGNILTSIYKSTTEEKNYKSNAEEKDALPKEDLKYKIQELLTSPKDKEEDTIQKLLNIILELLNINGADFKEVLKKAQNLTTDSKLEGLSPINLIFSKDEALNDKESIEMQIKEVVSLLDSNNKNQDSIKSLLSQLKPETIVSLSNKLVDMMDKHSEVQEFYNILTSLYKSPSDKKWESNFSINENETDEKVIAFNNNTPFHIEKSTAKEKFTEKSETESYLNEDKDPSAKELKMLEDIINQKDKTIKDTNFDKIVNRMNISSNSLKGVSNLEINGQDTVKEVVRVIKFMDKANIKELTLKINPKELGNITIKLTMEAGVMKANLTPTNKDTYNLLNKNLSELKSLMADSNIKVQEVSINIYNDDTTYFSSNFNENSFAQNQKERNTSGENKNNSFIEEDFKEEDNNDVLEMNNSVNMLV